MKKGNTREFLECIDHQDADLVYRGRFFFVNECCTERDPVSKKVVWARLEMYEMSNLNGNGWKTDVCSIVKPTVEETLEEFTHIPLIDGKTFWELEPELEWV